jgi:transcriptional regulator with XRE-family HTH domain
MDHIMPKPVNRAASRYAQDAIALLGNSIRIARLEQAMRMDETAERAGISRALLRRIEAGDPGSSIGAVFEVAAIVGVPLFEAERSRLATHLAHQADKLTLLPGSVRARRTVGVKDDF